MRSSFDGLENHSNSTSVSFRLLAIVVFIWFPYAAAAESPVQSLRIESRQVVATPLGDLELVYRMVNDSPKTIVAWEFGCVNATQAGKGVQGRVGTDAYFSFELNRAENEPLPPEILVPGGQLEQKVRLKAQELDGPFAGKSCGPVMVMFADMTYEGLDSLAEYWFGERAQEAVDARAAFRALEERLSSGKPLVAILDDLAVRLARPLSSPKGLGFGAQSLATYRDLLRQGHVVKAQEVLDSLDFRFQAAMRHLPASWQATVQRELAL